MMERIHVYNADDRRQGEWGYQVASPLDYRIENVYERILAAGYLDTPIYKAGLEGVFQIEVFPNTGIEGAAFFTLVRFGADDTYYEVLVETLPALMEFLARYAPALAATVSAVIGRAEITERQSAYDAARATMTNEYEK